MGLTYDPYFQKSVDKLGPHVETIKPKQWLFHHLSDAIEEGGKDMYSRLVLQSADDFAYLNSKLDQNSQRMEKNIKMIGEHSPQRIGFPFIAKLPTIYIVRDGRDVLVSWAFHLLNMCRKNKDECTLYDAAYDSATKSRLEKKLALHTHDPQHFTKNPHDLFTSDENGDDGFWVEAMATSWQSFKENHQNFYSPKNTTDYVGSSGGVALPASSRFESENASVYTVFYEQLHHNTFQEAENMYMYLGLNANTAKAPSTETRTLPGGFKNKGNSFYRKGAAGAWREYATETFVRTFHDIAQNALEFYGYEKNGDWAKSLVDGKDETKA